MHNKCKDLERAAKIRNVDGVREILGSTIDCIHCYPEVVGPPYVALTIHMCGHNELIVWVACAASMCLCSCVA
jgi:hypothetical protein